MLKIRLQRVGRKNNPSFDIVVIDSRKGSKSRNFVEKLGSYDAIRKTRLLNKERINHWINNGAQVSGTVHNILVSENVLNEKKINVLPKKSPIIKAEAKEEKDPVSKVENTETQKQAESSEPTQEEPVEEGTTEPQQQETIEEVKAVENVELNENQNQNEPIEEVEPVEVKQKDEAKEKVGNIENSEKAE